MFLNLKRLTVEWNYKRSLCVGNLQTSNKIGGQLPGAPIHLKQLTTLTKWTEWNQRGILSRKKRIMKSAFSMRALSIIIKRGLSSPSSEKLTCAWKSDIIQGLNRLLTIIKSTADDLQKMLIKLISKHKDKLSCNSLFQACSTRSRYQKKLGSIVKVKFCKEFSISLRYIFINTQMTSAPGGHVWQHFKFQKRSISRTSTVKRLFKTLIIKNNYFASYENGTSPEI